jgi:hypothetical protein
MPEIILKFTLPEEQAEAKLAQTGPGLFGVVWDLDQQLRSWLKHGHQFKTATEALENARMRLNDLLAERCLNLDELS